MSSRTETADFLTKVSAKRLKREIKNICNSYTHPWDTTAELVQNSIDAIKRWKRNNSEIRREHKIDITINQKRKEIIISDTGEGIDPSKMPDLLSPNETDKESNEVGIIGEKGVICFESFF
jgi:HSP90 family molecular chaperone